MFTTKDYEKLNTLMNSSSENQELIQNLIDSYQFTISKISHEIRNPLTLVYSTLQLIETQHPEVKGFRHWDHVIEDVEYANALLNELSMFNNSEKLRPKLFDFQEFIKHLALSFAASLSDTEIEFTSKVDSSLPQITGDKTKLQEVFLNLLKNARDAVGSSGSIRMEATTEDGQIIVTVSDTGCGIEKSQYKNIFTPFESSKQEGTGLGLPIAERIIYAHHGTITLESEPGNGTTFTVFLPVKQNTDHESC